jgi:hypothetical protein
MFYNSLARVVTTISTNMIRQKVDECFIYLGALSAEIGDNPKVIWIMDDTGNKQVFPEFTIDAMLIPCSTAAVEIDYFHLCSSLSISTSLSRSLSVRVSFPSFIMYIRHPDYSV